MTGRKTIGIVGARGHTGAELIRLIARHPALALAFVSSRELDGERVSDHVDAFNGALRYENLGPEAVAVRGADAVILALPNGKSADYVKLLGENAPATVIVDLSADHRFDDGWYYGLPELTRAHYRGEKRIANPGCYATAALLALAPLAQVADGPVVVDGKSGVSGAGRTLKQSSHAGSVLENVSPYAVGEHRHAPEIAQQLGFPVTFVPHLIPVRRGLLATCYLQTDADVRPLLEEAYAGSAVVRVLPEGISPEFARVQNTDAVEIGVYTDAATGTAIVICAIDNLGKGAAGQAVQNANLALGFDEAAGLRLSGVLV